jgi:hypothetical protein
MKKFKKLAIVLATIIMLSAFTITANAKTVETEEFGTLEYVLFIDESRLPSRGFSTVLAHTTISNPGSGKIVMTTMDVRNNSTGVLVATRTDSDPLVSYVSYDNEDRITLAAFTCHEARGNSSIARYLAIAF